MKHFNIIIYGKVQNVGFRYSAKLQADRLNITGFIQNLADDSVYLEVEGETKNLNLFLDWCHQGPPLAQINNIEINENKLISFTDFSIR